MKTKRSDDTKHSMNAHSNYKFGMTVIRLLRFGRLRTNCTANFDRNYFCAQRVGICANFTVSLIVGRFYCCDQIRIDCVLNASDLSILYSAISLALIHVQSCGHIYGFCETSIANKIYSQLSRVEKINIELLNFC